MTCGKNIVRLCLVVLCYSPVVLSLWTSKYGDSQNRQVIDLSWTDTIGDRLPVYGGAIVYSNHSSISQSPYTSDGTYDGFVQLQNGDLVTTVIGTQWLLQLDSVASTGQQLYKSEFYIGRYFPTSDYNVVSLLTIGSNVYISSGNTVVCVSYDGAEGEPELLWKASLPCSVLVASPTTLFCGGEAVVALDATSGNEVWRHNDTSASYLAVAPDGSTLFLAESFDLWAVSAETGTEVWRTSIGATSSFITVSSLGDKLFLTTPSVARAFDASSGAELWSSLLPSSAIVETPPMVTYDDSHLVVSSNHYSTIPGEGTQAAVFDTSTGDEVCIMSLTDIGAPYCGECEYLGGIQGVTRDNKALLHFGTYNDDGPPQRNYPFGVVDIATCTPWFMWSLDYTKPASSFYSPNYFISDGGIFYTSSATQDPVHSFVFD
mmetsp:Transcript_28617/g.79970  ORF Transcript_28617/g.79970 Transcript_28617/m.79970 type:complete len:432 (+) Transcript_28617:28-1323(+)|eukprot:CAMPEP_0119133594 /NCGR_PEP_ID=MMETSP1310-20130426/13457_1 /TAXON_ID=464262 /ORGANISM="Genus nov. species nov., Strain RCC2339" /LENGTH=431 /DNA_ID=CAMNT_0007124293 /DNA_START=15 /DNA_END=1310 /DNA_ORIENTATION=+